MKKIDTCRPLSELYTILSNTMFKNKSCYFICNVINILGRSEINETEWSVLKTSLALEKPSPTNNVKYYNSKYYNKLNIDSQKYGWWYDTTDSLNSGSFGTTEKCMHQKKLFLGMLIKKYSKINLEVSN